MQEEREENVKSAKKMEMELEYPACQNEGKDLKKPTEVKMDREELPKVKTASRSE